MRTSNDDIRRKLGLRIRCLREQRSISQRTFCLMIEMDRTYLIAVEHGRRNIAIDNLTKIAHGLGVTLSELFADVDDPGIPSPAPVALDGPGPEQPARPCCTRCAAAPTQ